MVGTNPAQYRETVSVRQVQVENDEANIVLSRHGLHGLVAIGGLDDYRAASELLEKAAKRLPDQAMVIDDQDFQRHRFFGLAAHQAREADGKLGRCFFVDRQHDRLPPPHGPAIVCSVFDFKFLILTQSEKSKSSRRAETVRAPPF